MNKKRIVSILKPIIIVIIIIALFAGCVRLVFGCRPRQYDVAIAIKDEQIVIGNNILTIDKSTLSGSYEEYFNEWAYYGNEDENEIRYVIRGYITNNSKKEISFLYFTFKVFDENENHLGYAPVSLRNLSPGETHKLVATYRKENDEEVSTFRPSATAYYNVGNQYEDMTCISLDLEIKNKDDIISLRDGKYTIDRATLKGEFIESDEGAHHDKFLITGNITNNSNMYAEELGLGFKLFDMNGIVIATIGAGIYFEAGETQEIKTWLIGKEARRVDSFELRNANFAHWLPR